MPNKGSHGYPDLSSIHGKMTFVCKIARKPEIRQDDFGLQADARKTRLLQNLRCEYKKRQSRNLMTHPSTRLDASLVFCFTSLGVVLFPSPLGEETMSFEEEDGNHNPIRIR